MKRKTFASEFVIEGIGLHRGSNNLLVVKPYKGKGIIFKDPDKGRSVLASVENVVSTTRCTVIGSGDFTISTVEHLLSCFMAFEIDDAEIEIHGDEIPAFDGSVLSLCETIKRVGVVEKEEEADVIEIDEPFSYLTSDSFYKVEKADGVVIECFFENPHPIVGSQRFEFKLTIQEYISELAPARTFAFEEEVKLLQESGLAKGGSLSNAVVIGKDRILNEGGLRFPDEFVRHKIVDLLGDLKLLSARLKDIKITAKRPSHKANISLVKLIKARSVYERCKGS